MKRRGEPNFHNTAHGLSGNHGRRFALLITSVVTIMATAVSVYRIQVAFAQTTPSQPSTTQSSQPPLGSEVPRAHKDKEPASSGISEAAMQEAEGTFQSQCSSCHGEKGGGDGPWHTQFYPMPANLGLVHNAPTMMKSIIVNGVPGTMMPAHPDMDDKTIQGITQFLASQPVSLSEQWHYPWVLKGEIKKLSAQQGVKPYVTFCMGCHGPEGDGQSEFGKNHFVWPKPAIFHARNSDIGRLYHIITYGRYGTFMSPQMPKLTETARWQLALYVQSLYDDKSQAAIRTPQKPIPTVRNRYYHGDTTAVNEGRDRYMLWCSPCHGEMGRGSFLAPKLIDRQWRYGGGSDRAVWTILEEGVPGQLMPSWKKLPEEIRWKMITYLRHNGGLPDPLIAEQERQQGGQTGREQQNQIRQGGK